MYEYYLLKNNLLKPQSLEEIDYDKLCAFGVISTEEEREKERKQRFEAMKRNINGRR